MNIVDLLHNDEGYRQFPYTDTKGKLTIGIGFNLTDVGLSLEESLAVLNIRIGHLVNDQLSMFSFWNDLNEVRQAVLIDVGYNIGFDSLLKFKKMISALKKGDYQEASVQLLDSDAARTLTSRYLRLADMLKSGEWLN